MHPVALFIYKMYYNGLIRQILILINNSVALVRERTIPTERPPLVSEISAKFADRGCGVFSVTDLYDHILGFLDRSRYFFFQVAPQL
jgi:hypothetical protein